jgi:hypothetical protein
MIDRSKATYDRYRSRARDVYSHVAVTHGERFGTNTIHVEIKVPEHANVQLCEDGAFVEAIVWVPKATMEFVPFIPKEPEPLDEGAEQGKYDACDRSD